MDEKNSNQLPREVSTPKPIQSQPARADAGTVALKTAQAVSSVTENSGIANKPAPLSPNADAAKQSRGLTTVLEASRAELDRLLAETQSIHERSWRVIHTLLEDSQLRASQAVDASLVHFENEIKDRISSEMAMLLQNFDVEASARIAAHLDQGLATSKQRQHSIEQDLAVAVAENRKQLDQISTNTADVLRQRGQSLLADLQKEANRHLADLAKNAGQISKNIEQLADSLGAELKKRTSEAVQDFHSRIGQACQQAVSQAEKRIAEAANTSTVELAKQARQVVDREMSEFLSHALRRFDRASEAESSNKSS
jgi:hypothetical protein